MRYKVTWTMYFIDSNMLDTVVVAIIETTIVSKARYAAYKQVIPDRGYHFEWFINEIEAEKESERVIHKLKILPQYFENKLQGVKKWKVRKNDRPFKDGDILQSEGWNEETGYAGRLLQEYIKKIYTEVPGIKEGYIIMNTEYISASYREKGEWRILKVYIEKDIYILSGIYCAQCSKKKTDIQGNAYCDEFGDWIHTSNDGTGRIVKCVSCFRAMQRQITGKR